MTLDWHEGALAEGLACYRQKHFFAAHELWESVWVRAEEPEKTFLQALIHITVAFHHLARGNGVGAVRQLQRALRKLEEYPPEFGGVDVEALRTGVERWLNALESAAPVTSLALPPIR